MMIKNNNFKMFTIKVWSFPEHYTEKEDIVNYIYISFWK